MTPVLLLRHGRTAWNEIGRIQGREDVTLCEAGREALRGRCVPEPYRDWRAISSPLVRAAETARLVGLGAASVEPRIVEMDYGEWSGLTRDDIRARYGAHAVAALEARGIDFRPPGGESPRELRTRLVDWLRDVVADGRPVVAVTHKGIIRMALAMATGWDLTSKVPVRLDWTAAHRFVADAAGRLTLERANVGLEDAPP